jgi:hypothetical protein
MAANNLEVLGMDDSVAVALAVGFTLGGVLFGLILGWIGLSGS